MRVVPLRVAIVAPLMCLAAADPSFANQSPWGAPVGRETNARNADLISALIRDGRFEDALGICRRQLQSADPRGDTAAKWIIRQSRIRTAQQMDREQFAESDVQAIKKPLSDFVRSYPEHRRRLFLQAAEARVLREAAVHRVLQAAVSPRQAKVHENASTQLLRATTEIKSLARRIDDARSRLGVSRDAGDLALIADLGRLQQELLVDAVSLTLMQTALFLRGSDDQIAAATKAEQAATNAIAILPGGTAARREVERLKVEAIFHFGQYSRASEELVELIRLVGEPIPPQVQALQVRLEIADGKMSQAEQRLTAYYGSRPETAPRSIDMDLARLEFLVLGNSGDVGQWLDVLRQRGGVYARRRAEAIALSHLAGRTTQQHRATIDPSIIAAQGQDWLRRGNPGRAGELLSAAAASESDPDRAIQLARQAAAAWAAADRTHDAAIVLAEIAVEFPDGNGAAAAHLQAAYMIFSQQGVDPDKQVEAMLRTNLKAWPSSSVALSARTWLIKLLASQGRNLDAAEVATNLPVEQITQDKLDSIINRWRAVFHEIDTHSPEDRSQRFQAAFLPLLESDLARQAYRLAAALLLERNDLSGWPSSGTENAAVTFADALIEFRRYKTVSQTLDQPPDQYTADATWRLMRDGRKYPQMRAPIADLLDKWNGNSKPSLERAERLLWKGQAGPSVDMIRRLIEESKDRTETTKRAASMLSSSGDPHPRREAIRLWDELASGSPQAGPLWHEAKLAAIGLLQQSGDIEEAERRSKYILLTTPSMDADLRRQYEAIGQ